MMHNFDYIPSNMTLSSIIEGVWQAASSPVSTIALQRFTSPNTCLTF